MLTGYHFTRAQLDKFDDPDEAHARRGAYWTFDGAAFVQKMQELQTSGGLAAASLLVTCCTLLRLVHKQHGCVI